MICLRLFEQSRLLVDQNSEWRKMHGWILCWYKKQIMEKDSAAFSAMYVNKLIYSIPYSAALPQ
jgi:hypothetical protein